jgi:hypothetical protein
MRNEEKCVIGAFGKDFFLLFKADVQEEEASSLSGACCHVRMECLEL